MAGSPNAQLCNVFKTKKKTPTKDLRSSVLGLNVLQKVAADVSGPKLEPSNIKFLSEAALG